MVRGHRRPAKPSQNSKVVSTENKQSTDIPNGSGSHSLATPPVVEQAPHVTVWDPDCVPEADWAAVDAWNNMGESMAWEWEAAGDDSIASDDPYKEKKLAWRRDHDHVYSSKHRVSRWREHLPVKRLLLSRVEDVETIVEQPPSGEIWDGRTGCRLKSRTRSESRGKHGRRDRTEKIQDWKRQVDLMIADGGLVLDIVDSVPGSFSEESEEWIDKLMAKEKWKHVTKAKAKAFFKLSMREKVSRIERLAREIANGPSWDIS